MPLLIYAVPLSENWLGKHYWKTPRPEDLPEELEYLRYAEVQERFQKLNNIARPIYPTYWPNVAILLLLSVIFAAATAATTRLRNNLTVIGQGAYFFIPVVFVIWIKVRKETKARSCRKFKHRCQKLLRIWTAQDGESHAMQWKLRCRKMSVAQRWLSGRDRNRDIDSRSFNNIYGSDHQHQPVPERNGHQDQFADGSINQQVQQRSEDHTTIEFSDGSHENTDPFVVDPATPSNAAVTLRINTQLHREAISGVVTTSTQIVTAHDEALAEPSATTTVTTTATTTATATATATVRAETSAAATEPTASFWSALKNMMLSYYCCTYISRERKIWLIEISLRECQIDDYTVTIPSPVYCDYRLPAYDDVFSGEGAHSGQGRPVAASARSSRVMLSRHRGSPPAYESESDQEEEHDDDEEDEDEEDSRIQRTGDDMVPQSRATTPLANAGATNVGNSQQMVMIPHPTVLSSIAAPSSSMSLHAHTIPIVQDESFSTNSLPLVESKFQ